MILSPAAGTLTCFRIAVLLPFILAAAVLSLLPLWYWTVPLIAVLWLWINGWYLPQKVGGFRLFLSEHTLYIASGVWWRRHRHTPLFRVCAAERFSLPFCGEAVLLRFTGGIWFLFPLTAADASALCAAIERGQLP